jgi:hypothetical protein
MEDLVQLVAKDECAPTEPYHRQDQSHGQARIEVHLEEELSERHGQVKCESETILRITLNYSEGV